MKPLSMLILLCSGPGAGEAMRMSSNISMVTFLLMVGMYLVLFSFRKQINRKLFVVPLVFIVLHPYLWIGVRSGDCGFMMRNISLVSAGLYLVVWAFIFFRRKKADS